MAYKLENISVKFDNRSILDNVSCTIEENKWIGVVGRTGAGKSTFVQVLKGLLSFEGNYYIDGKLLEKDFKGNIRPVPEIGVVFQYPEQQLFETTVYKELAFGLKLLGHSKKEMDEAIHTILPKTGLSKELLELPPFQLSGGQKRRIAIASILLMKPKVLIADEPTAGLDPISRLEMLQLFKSWQQETGGTILLISHNMEDVAEYADEVLVFHDGQLRAQLAAKRLFLEKSEVLEEAGLMLPESLEALKLVEQMLGQKIEVADCKEETVLEALRPYLCEVGE